MSKITLEIKSDQIDVVLDAVMQLAQKMKFEAKILSEDTDDEIKNFDELSSLIISNLDKPSNKAVFERLKNK